MRHWPQMVDTLFWPFAIKAMAKRMNSLHVDNEGNTPELLMYGVDLETIPIKNFHTLFCLIYIVGHCLQSVGGPRPPNGNRGQEWEYILGTPPSMPEVWPWFSALKQQESLPSIMSFFMMI
jgi:hypothetical protein